MRHSEEERDLGSLGEKCSESIQLLGGEQSQPKAGMAWARREWRTGQEPLTHLHMEQGWPWSCRKAPQLRGDTGIASWTAQLAKTGTLCCDTRNAR